MYLYYGRKKVRPLANETERKMSGKLVFYEGGSRGRREPCSSDGNYIAERRAARRIMGA